MMMLAVFVAAVAVALVLDRQERRHRFDIQWEYERLGWEMPPRRPKIPTLEAIVNIVVGLFFLVMGGTLLYTFLALGPKFGAAEEQYILAFCLAAGITLMIVGGRALWENRTQRESGKKVESGPGEKRS